MGIFDFVTGYGGPLEGQSGGMGGLGGLFDPQDPRKAGLLSAAFGLLGQQGFGNAGLLGMQASQQARSRALQEKRQSLQDELVKNQLDQQRREAELSKLPGRFFRAPTDPVVDATGGMETAPENPNNSNAGAMDYRGLIQAYMGAGAPERAMQTLQLQSAMNPTRAPVKLGAGEKLLDPTTYKPLAENQKPVEDSEAIRDLKTIYGDGTPAYRAALERLGIKKTTHSPPVQVSYGQPVAGVDAAGNPVFFQPDKGGGAPAIVPGVKPAPQNRDTKLPAELQRMQIAGDAMVGLLDKYEKLIKDNNPRDPMVQANPAIRANIESVKRNLELQFKELQALGALAGPDIDIMRQALADPFSFKGAFYGREGLLAQTKQARELVKLRSDAVLKSQGQAQPKPTDNDPLGIR